MVVLINLLFFLLISPVGPLLTGSLDQNGTEYDLHNLGKGYTIVDFAASWCKPCWKVLPKLEAFARANPDLRVLVISVDTDRAGRDRLVQKLGLTMPVLWDEHHRWAEALEPPGMPTTLILDEKGAVVYRHTGSSTRSWRQFTKKVEDLTRLP